MSSDDSFNVSAYDLELTSNSIIHSVTPNLLGLYGQVNKRIWWMPRR